MPEQDTLPIDPDYGIRVGGMDGVLRERRLSGAVSERVVAPPQRIFTLPFRDRSTDDVELLRDFKRSMKAKHFRFDHDVYVNNAGVYLPRSFPVHWLDDTLPEESLAMHESHDFDVRLLEAVGKNVLKNNYISNPLDLSIAAWVKQECSVTGNRTIADASGIFRASRVTPNGGATDAVLQITAALGPVPQFLGRAVKFTVALKAASGTPSIQINVNGVASPLTCNLTGSWQTFTLTGTLGGAAGDLIAVIGGGNTWPEADGAIDIYLPKVTFDQTLGFFPEPVAGHPGIFLEGETDAVFQGANWSAVPSYLTDAHGNAEITNGNTNTTDVAVFTYEGYGFEVWARRASNFGICEVLLDDAIVGQFDQYNASTQVAAALFAHYDVALGQHRVKLRTTNSKNSASGGKTITADAIKVFY